jgi:hypothetical protein
MLHNRKERQLMLPAMQACHEDHWLAVSKLGRCSSTSTNLWLMSAWAAVLRHLPL